MMAACPTTASPTSSDKVFNAAVVAAATRLGLSVWGSRVLRVRGRSRACGAPHR